MTSFGELHERKPLFITGVDTQRITRVLQPDFNALAISVSADLYSRAREDFLRYFSSTGLLPVANLFAGIYDSEGNRALDMLRFLRVHFPTVPTHIISDEQGIGQYSRFIELGLISSLTKIDEEFAVRAKLTEILS